MYNIITIEREYGSGGNEIGKRLAKELGYTFYDNNILVEAAKRLGIPPIYLSDLEETSTGSIIFNLSKVLSKRNASGNDQPLATKLFLTEKVIIEEIVQKEKCVIVGRCASDVLKNNPDCLSVFIHASHDYRRNRAVECEKIKPDEVDEIIRKVDRRRRDFYSTHTGHEWGNKKYFEVCLNSGKIGIEYCIKLLKAVVTAE